MRNYAFTPRTIKTIVTAPDGVIHHLQWLQRIAQGCLVLSIAIVVQTFFFYESAVYDSLYGHILYLAACIGGIYCYGADMYLLRRPKGAHVTSLPIYGFSETEIRLIASRSDQELENCITKNERLTFIVVLLPVLIFGFGFTFGFFPSTGTTAGMTLSAMLPGQFAALYLIIIENRKKYGRIAD